MRNVAISIYILLCMLQPFFSTEDECALINEMIVEITPAFATMNKTIYTVDFCALVMEKSIIDQPTGIVLQKTTQNIESIMQRKLSQTIYEHDFISFPEEIYTYIYDGYQVRMTVISDDFAKSCSVFALPGVDHADMAWLRSTKMSSSIPYLEPFVVICDIFMQIDENRTDHVDMNQDETPASFRFWQHSVYRPSSAGGRKDFDIAK